METSCLLLILLFCFVRNCFGIYFFMQANDRKCFVQEIPEDTLVMGNYKVQTAYQQNQQFYDNPDVGIQVEVFDPDGTTILSNFYTLEGKFTFTSAKSGPHPVCLYPSRSDPRQQFENIRLRVHLTMASGEHIMDYREVAEKNKFNELQLRVRQLLDQVQQMQKEQNYQRTREERFRQSSETTNRRVLWWALAQVVVVVCVCTWQLRHLRWYFRAKKIV